MKEVIDAVIQAKGYMEERLKELEAKADSLVDKVIDVLNRVKESNWTWFIVGAAAMFTLMVVVF